jgi:hypothetical protein
MDLNFQAHKVEGKDLYCKLEASSITGKKHRYIRNYLGEGSGPVGSGPVAIFDPRPAAGKGIIGSSQHYGQHKGSFFR